MIDTFLTFRCQISNKSITNVEKLTENDDLGVAEETEIVIPLEGLNRNGLERRMAKTFVSVTMVMASGKMAKTIAVMHLMSGPVDERDARRGEEIVRHFVQKSGKFFRLISVESEDSSSEQKGSVEKKTSR